MYIQYASERENVHNFQAKLRHYHAGTMCNNHMHYIASTPYIFPLHRNFNNNGFNVAICPNETCLSSVPART